MVLPCLWRPLQIFSANHLPCPYPFLFLRGISFSSPLFYPAIFLSSREAYRNCSRIEQLEATETSFFSSSAEGNVMMVFFEETEISCVPCVPHDLFSQHDQSALPYEAGILVVANVSSLGICLFPFLYRGPYPCLYPYPCLDSGWLSNRARVHAWPTAR